VSEPKRLTRQERAFQWRRDHVLESAERVFARKGFHEATMQEMHRRQSTPRARSTASSSARKPSLRRWWNDEIPEINEQLLGQAGRGKSAARRLTGSYEHSSISSILTEIYSRSMST